MLRELAVISEGQKIYRDRFERYKDVEEELSNYARHLMR